MANCRIWMREIYDLLCLQFWAPCFHYFLHGELTWGVWSLSEKNKQTKSKLLMLCKQNHILHYSWHENITDPKAQKLTDLNSPPTCFFKGNSNRTVNKVYVNALKACYRYLRPKVYNIVGALFGCLPRKCVVIFTVDIAVMYSFISHTQFTKI